MAQEQIPTPENTETEIEKLLETLDSYAPKLLEKHPELQEEWYWVEMEARVSQDRATAGDHLRNFLGVLESERLKEMFPKGVH